ncbi:hypothetical protein BCR34DRAFT_588341 [Clohesyomyces aquaticus]|uniref:Uncharacterized protein n=1 Tax=Clohesyomyces aquaticus TaxID=1231657 RepID=A0A1Y1ZKL6_9PLEO|nr:hypothetical protein BCR34DRAFT_588341 [Clohesyomyces aquaticus]
MANDAPIATSATWFTTSLRGEMKVRGALEGVTLLGEGLPDNRSEKQGLSAMETGIVWRERVERCGEGRDGCRNTHFSWGRIPPTKVELPLAQRRFLDLNPNIATSEFHGHPSIQSVAKKRLGVRLAGLGGALSARGLGWRQWTEMADGLREPHCQKPASNLSTIREGRLKPNLARKRLRYFTLVQTTWILPGHDSASRAFDRK